MLEVVDAQSLNYKYGRSTRAAPVGFLLVRYTYYAGSRIHASNRAAAMWQQDADHAWWLHFSYH